MLKNVSYVLIENIVVHHRIKIILRSFFSDPTTYLIGVCTYLSLCEQISTGKILFTQAQGIKYTISNTLYNTIHFLSCVGVDKYYM